MVSSHGFFELIITVMPPIMVESSPDLHFFILSFQVAKYIDKVYGKEGISNCR